MWAAFAHFDELPDDAFDSVRLAVSGAARLPVSVAERVRDRFGLRIREGYGLTEAGATVTSSVGVEPRFGSVGLAFDGVEMRLINADGEALVGDQSAFAHVTRRHTSNVVVGYHAPGVGCGEKKLGVPTPRTRAPRRARPRSEVHPDSTR